MSFLDRFKSQPRWKHADPAIRAAAVAEIPEDPEGDDALLELAASDEDVRVRRAAGEHIRDVELLVRLARTERDADLRRELGDRLVAIAFADVEADAARALDGLDDQKQFSAVARSSPHDTIRTAALGRVHDTKALGGIARQATDPQTALDAVARIADQAELLNVALKTDHKDAGVAALEKAAESAGGDAREMLETVASRAKNKAVSRRARAMVQAIEEAEAARKIALDEWQRRVAGVMAKVEAIAASPSVMNAREELDRTGAEWREAAADGIFELDPDTAARFGALVESACGAIDQHERIAADERAAAERRQALRAAQAARIERVDAVRGDDLLDVVSQARTEWTALGTPGQPEPGDEGMAARFQDACRRAEERHCNRQEIQRVAARLEELSVEAEQITTADELSEERWTAVREEWRSLLAQSDALDAAVTERYAAAEARVGQRAEERRAAAERTRRQHVQRIEQLIDRVARRAAAEDLTLREVDRLTRELRMAIEAPIDLQDRERQALLDRLKAAQTALGPRLHELREMDEWKRFANAAVQEELIAKTEALRAKYGFDAAEGPKPEDLDKAAHDLHEIQERWKQAAEAPRAQAQALWHRYRQAADPIQAKVREFFAVRSEERKANLERKLAIIERADALAGSTDWIKTAEELKTLQAEWQTIGPVPRQDTRATWKRFREACDQFFTRRNADLAERKETWSANLAKKEALCARAEKLSLSMDWDRTAAEIRRLQAEWKTVGPVRRNKSETIWQRFRAACDTFFDRYKRRDEIDLQARQADREALVTELESLVPAERAAVAEMQAPEVVGDIAAEMQASELAGDIAPPAPTPLDNAALLERVRSLRSRWNQTSPAVRQGADPLSARFMSALERLMAAYPEAFHGTELDAEGNRQKMEKLCDRVEGFLKGVAAPASGSQALAEMLREALAANTIGGRAGEESKWRAMGEDVRQAQASWNRLGPVPGEAGRQITERFHRACSRFFDQYRRHVAPAAQPQGGGRPVGAR
jgi:hypothetical protein